MKLPVAEQQGIIYLPRLYAPLRLSALARREVKAGEFFFMRRKRRRIDLKTASGLSADPLRLIALARRARQAE